ncbi:AprI/Inh family metalloprotease inhibitor [Solirhodobacter olei]|uniref:AprI/Inh family metalloprotease inhibitor n=1 Tax=Solirhodobacter olei TaxID=2493082 RepID=UPI0013E3D974|nr:AprI/Inh family metalloprotease inhibitor [Solirhodobacter olei]
MAAFAQDSAPSLPEFISAFAGTWSTYDTSLADGSLCRIVLGTAPKGDHYKAVQRSCSGPLAGVAGWGVVDQQLALIDQSGAMVAHLGGNQNQISGSLSTGREVVLEREPMAGQVHQKWASEQCLFVGYGAKCADAAALAVPQSGGGSDITVLVKLNARSEPRPDAKVVRVFPPKACLPVAQCVITAAGPWCQVAAHGHKAWVSKVAVRLKKFPVVTFVDGCAAAGK